MEDFVIETGKCPKCYGSLGLFWFDQETVYWFGYNGETIPRTTTKIVRYCQNPKCSYREVIHEERS